MATRIGQTPDAWIVADGNGVQMVPKNASGAEVFASEGLNLPPPVPPGSGPPPPAAPTPPGEDISQLLERDSARRHPGFFGAFGDAVGDFLSPTRLSPQHEEAIRMARQFERNGEPLPPQYRQLLQEAQRMQADIDARTKPHASRAGRTGTQQAPTPGPSAFQGPMSGAPGPGGVSGSMGQMVMGSMPPAGGAYAPAMGVSTKGYDAAVKQTQDALRSQYEAGRQQAAAQAGFYEEEQTRVQAAAERQQQLAARQQAEMKSGMQRLQQLQDEATRTVETVDPNRYWASRSTGQKILAAVSVVLGGAGWGFTGARRNDAFEHIQNIIQQDIELQREAIGRGREDRNAAVASQLTTLGLMRQQFGDDVAAESATNALSNELAALKLKQIQAQTGDAQMKATIDMQIGMLGQESEKHKQELALRLSQLGLQQAELGLRQEEMRGKRIAAAAEEMYGPPELQVPGVGIALDKEAAKEARKLTANKKAALVPLKKLMEFREKYGGELLNREQLAAARTYATRLQLALKEDGQLGALDKGSAEFLERMVSSDPGRYGFELSRLKALEDAIEGAYWARVESYMNPGRSSIGPAAQRYNATPLQ